MMEQNEMSTDSGRGAVCSAGSVGLLLGGMAAGAALMYLFDPERGRRRRSLLSDQLTSKANRLGETAGKKARHLRNRAQGLAHEAGALFRQRGQTEEQGDGRANQHLLGAQPISPTPMQGM